MHINPKTFLSNKNNNAYLIDVDCNEHFFAYSISYMRILLSFCRKFISENINFRQDLLLMNKEQPTFMYTLHMSHFPT